MALHTKRVFSTLLASLMVTACAAPIPTVRLASAGASLTMAAAAARSETGAFLAEEGVTVSPAERADLEGMFANAVAAATDADTLAVPGATQNIPGFGTVTPGNDSPARPGLPSFFVNPTPQPNDTTLYLDDNEIFPEMLRLVRGSQKKIQISYFLLGGDIGLSIANAMVERAKAGVELQIMLDPKLGLSGDVAAGIARVIAYLQANNVHFKLYPLALYGKMPNKMQQRLQINHNKIAVFDGTTAFMGSMNLDDIARVNHDLMVKIQGPSATELGAMLDNEWPFGAEYGKPSMSVKANSEVRFTQTAPQQRNTKEMLIKTIGGAQQSVHVAMYEFGDADVAAALVAAYKRGVDVRVILDPKGSALAKYGASILPDGMPNLLPARELLKVGAQVRWFKPWRYQQELHMKAMSVDGKTLVAGSTNWTSNAFTRWRETSFVMEGPAATAWEAEFGRMWNTTSTRLDKLTLKQRLTARLCEYMNKKDYAFW